MYFTVNLLNWNGLVSILLVLSSAGLMFAGSSLYTGSEGNDLSGHVADSEYNVISIADDARQTVTVADGDTVVVKSTGTDLSYDITEIRAKAGSTITIRYVNSSNMPHNIVFVYERADIQPVGVAALQARETEYIPQEESLQERIFGYTALARPGFTEYVTITVPPPGTYPYICTYPGHFTMMQGDLISE